MTERQWAPVGHDDRYHGQVDTADRRSYWVFRRLIVTATGGNSLHA